MRFVSIDISGYGRLGERTIDGLDAFTVLHGPNEAGKSTFRRLLRDLLFGFPTNASSSHPYSFSRTMEARASIALEDGRNLTLSRKRSKQEFLRIEPAEFGNDAWKALLSGMDDAIYGRMLCCSAPEMLETAVALRQGRFLETLRSDASGGLRSARELLVEAETLVARFATGQGRKRHRGFLDKARKELAERSTSWSEAAGRARRLRELEERIVALQGRMDALAEESLRRERLADVARAQERAVALEEELLRRGAPSTFPARARERSEDLSAERMRLRADIRDLEETRRGILDSLATLPPPDPVLDAGGDVLGSMAGRRDSVESMTRDLPRLREAASLARARYDDARGRLLGPKGTEASSRGRQADSAQASLFDAPAESESVCAEDATTDRASALRDLSAIRATWKDAESHAEQARRDLGRSEETLEGLAPPDDLGERERTLANLWYGESRAIESARQCVESETLRLRNAERALGRLEPKIALAGLPPLDVILRAPLPAQRDADSAAARWREVDEARDVAARRLEAVERDLDALGGDRSDEVATTERRDARRARRDALWDVVRARLEGSPSDVVPPLLQPGETLPNAYETALRAADADADALLDQADTLRRAAALRAEADSLRTEIARIHATRDAAYERWAALWKDTGFLPGSDPESGRSWYASRLEAQEPWVEREESRRVLARSQTALDSFAERVRQILELEALAPENAIQTAGATYDRACRIKSARVAFERENSRLCDDIARVRELLAERERAVAAQSAAWQSSLDAAFPHGTAISDPDTLLEELRRLVEMGEDCSAAATRLAEAERAREEIVHRIAPAIGDLGIQGDGLDRFGELLDRRTAALQARSSRERETIRLQGTQQRIVQRQDDLTRLETQIAALWTEAGTSDESTFLADLASFEAAAPLRTELDTCRRVLDAARPSDLQAAAECASSRWEELLDESRGAFTSLNAERDQLLRDKGALERELDDLARRDDEPLRRRAALRQAVDDLNEEAHAHLRNRLAILVLQRACDAFAARRTPPLQAWSSQYLSTITGGRWDSIDLSREDRLVVSSSERDETLDEHALSSGTADQVRLALRMAVARQWASGREPLPFLLDDVLATTDADRLGRALAALRDLSNHVQILYFTCHASVAERAGAAGATIVGI